MNKIKKITLCLALFIFGLLISTNVKAASASLSANKTTVNVGETVTINVSINAAAWEIHVSGSVSGNYADASENAENTSITKQLSFTPNAEGTYTVNMSGNVTDGSTNATVSVNGSVEIIAKATSSGTTSGNTTTTEKSSVATLANLGITPNDFSGFTRNKTTYNVTVPSNVEKIEVYATKGQSGQTITGTGSKTLNDGLNTFNVVVTAEDGKTTKTYTINVTRGDNATSKSSVATLSNLGITPNDFTGFKSDKTDYQANVPSNVEKIEIYAKKSQDGQTIEGTGIKTLEEGLNKFEIVVTAEDGQTKKTYTINVTRGETTDIEEQPEETTEIEETEVTEEIFGLTELKISGLTLNPKFENDIYEYQVDLLEDKDMLEITAVPANENLKVEILGNEDLQEGENIITIIVKGENEEDVVTYQIIVNKEVSLLEDNTEQENQQKIKKIIIASIAGCILLIVVIVIIAVKIKKNKENEFSIPYSNIDFENTDEHENVDENENISEDIEQVDSSFEESPKIKKHKGKRFK